MGETSPRHGTRRGIGLGCFHRPMLLSGWALNVLLLLCSAPLLAGCVLGQRSLKLPATGEATVIVGSAALPAPINQLARHPWVALRDEGSQLWERWEVMCCPGRHRRSTVRKSIRSPLSDYGGGGGDVRIHGMIGGTRAKRIAACVRERAPEYPHRHRYLVWPGPNSNTFVDWLVRACDINVDLPATSIGKDYRGLFGVSPTAGGTGVQLETPLLGLKLGLTEGIELHVLTFPIGIDLWPPALILPVGPGRLGIEDR